MKKSLLLLMSMGLVLSFSGVRGAAATNPVDGPDGSSGQSRRSLQTQADPSKASQPPSAPSSAPSSRRSIKGDTATAALAATEPSAPPPPSSKSSSRRASGAGGAAAASGITSAPGDAEGSGKGEKGKARPSSGGGTGGSSGGGAGSSGGGDGASGGGAAAAAAAVAPSPPPDAAVAYDVHQRVSKRFFGRLSKHPCVRGVPGTARGIVEIFIDDLQRVLAPGAASAAGVVAELTRIDLSGLSSRTRILLFRELTAAANGRKISIPLRFNGKDFALHLKPEVWQPGNGIISGIGTN